MFSVHTLKVTGVRSQDSNQRNRTVLDRRRARVLLCAHKQADLVISHDSASSFVFILWVWAHGKPAAVTSHRVKELRLQPESVRLSSASFYWSVDLVPSLSSLFTRSHLCTLLLSYLLKAKQEKNSSGGFVFRILNFLDNGRLSILSDLKSC